MSDACLTPSPTTSDRPLQELEDEITGLAAYMTAVDHRFLELLAEFDERMGWCGWGVRSCAHWLSWKCGIGLVAARDKLRVARALRGLPKVGEAMRQGRVSYSKVRAITRVAAPETESFFLSVAENGTASHVENLVRQYRACERREELHDDQKRHDTRELTHFWAEDGSLVIRGRLPPEQGALVLQALQAAEQELREAQWKAEGDSAESSAPTGRQRRADAWVRCAESFLAGGDGCLQPGERHQVHVHVDHEVLCDPEREGESALEAGPAIPPDTARRMACDASVVVHVGDSDGQSLDVGRRTRAIPPAMRRALLRRDGGCRFPGCSCERFVDGHHIKHWADGGETKLDNLILLCRHHHRLVHECGFGVERRDGALRFYRPDGVLIDPVPEAAAPRSPELDVAIDARTGVPHWGGESLDYTYCLTALFQRRDRARAAKDDSAESLH